MKPHDPTSRLADEHPQSAERPATAVAMERSARTLYRFLMRRLQVSQDAEDLLQTIFLRFWQNPQHELVQKPTAYLYQIATNVLAEHRLRQSRSLVIYDSEVVTDRDEQASSAEAWVDALGETQGLRQQLERVLIQVPPMYRAALVLRACEGLSFEEIGAKLGLSTKSAKTYVSRAIARCRLADWNR